MSDDWHKDTPEPRHWLFYVLVEDRHRAVSPSGWPRAVLGMCE